MTDRCLHLITRPSIHHTLKARQIHRAGREDWQELTLATLGVAERICVLVSLQEDAAGAPSGIRVR